MITYILASILIFVLGFAIAGFIFRKKESEKNLFNLLYDFKKSIDEYKNQNDINTKEVKEAIKDASELTRILTTNQNLKGQFGEECLELILKTCYPDENINYIKQFDTTNEEGKKIRPDYLVKLPNNKSVLIDCKLNLEKYIDYKNTNENTKKQDFIKDLNNTVNLLANKDYFSAQNITQPDFILMYIPLEPVITTLYTDSDFLGVIKNANEKNIIIVGNSSILTTLRLIKLIWAQDRQDRNIDTIIQTAQNIYDLIAAHSQNLYKIKECLEENQKSFNREFDKITTDNKLFKSAQALKELGINSTVKKEGKKLQEINIHSEFLK